MPQLVEEIFPFRKAAMNSWELSAAFVFFFLSFLKRTPLGFCHFSFMKGSNTRKIKTESEFRHGRRDVSLDCTKHFRKMTCLFSCLPFSTLQWKLKLHSLVSLFYFMK
jgi:hypothetical protein